MKKIGLSLLCIYMFTGCSHKKIKITNEYIINENWSKKNEQASANSITISRMKVKKDSTINPFSDVSQVEILNKLEDDSSFIHYANVKIKQRENYTDKKIYFNVDNGFYWGGNNRNRNNDVAKTIGVLTPDSWYKFSDLGVISQSCIYVYIDSVNKSHCFVVNLANY